MTIKNNILFVAIDNGYDQNGGPNVNIKRLLPRLQKRKITVSCIVFVPPGKDSLLSEYLIRHNVPVFQIYNYKSTEFRVRKLVKLLKKIKPTIFIPNVSISGCYAAKFARDAGAYTIGVYRSDDQFHCDYLRQFFGGDQQWRLDGLVSVTENCFSVLSELDIPFPHTKVIPSGVPVPSPPLAARNSSEIKLVYIGKIKENQKRISLVIETILSVLEAFPNATAELIGEYADSYSSEIFQEMIESRGFGSRLKYIGPISPDFLHDYISQFNYQIFHSEYEGVPGALMDGMICGVIPICFSSSPGIHELVIDGITGFLVDNHIDDPVQIIKSLELNSHKKAEISASARQHIFNGYTIDAAVGRWEELFSEFSLSEEPNYRKVNFSGYKYPHSLPGIAREDKRGRINYLKATAKASLHKILNVLNSMTHR